MIVIDASALVMVVLQEPGWEKVPIGSEVATLDYAYVEGMNAIWKAVRWRELTREQGRMKITVLRMMKSSITTYRTEDFFERGLEIALDEGIAVYDAFYIALAESLDAKLVTADEKQYKAAKNYVPAKLV
ncbi:PIN domain-containing protein [Thermococcus chitonophagus]|uniref:PIN domain-containing protein n=1 Tax=Thermococcus chitonophagus TaxID=54262 RepID=A0A160VR43_9EURY|nr:type II toxin-antitoxin system VapC family toxin [Thermococcus chitonophagus]ASJ15966.1 PIN domain-containing protein [Thermococcus chitonophagus]CUX77210.1 hypothetical protein CHITON_0431 [Thermococcus chitonophagus]